MRLQQQLDARDFCGEQRSMVLRSHSRAIASEVGIAPITVMIIVTAPGIIKC